MIQKYYDLNAESCSIRCKLYCEDRAEIRSVILFGHGFGGHKDNQAAQKFAERVLSKNRGVALITFNWPCHGDDIRKRLRLEDCDRYLSLLLTHITDAYGHWDPDSGTALPPTLFGYANSFGGYLFLKYVSEHGNPFAKIALRSPAIDMYAVLTESVMEESDLERIRKGKTVSVGFDRKIEVDQPLLDSLRQADIRRRDYLVYADDIIIFHGTDDEIVPYATVKRFAEDNVIEFVTVEGGDHRFLNQAKMHAVSEQIISFFQMK